MPVHIEMFGVRDQDYESIRSALREALEAEHIQYDLQDVQLIDEFITEGVESVPAIRVDYRKIFHVTPDFSHEEFVSAIRTYILATRLQRIICPIDFSESSLHAARWAANFSRVMGRPLRLVHVFQPYGETTFGIEPDLTGTLLDLQATMERIAAELAAFTEMPPDVLVEVGDPLQTLVRISKDDTTGSLIMGTRGASGLSRIFGTLSSSTARHAFAPVFLIPPSASLEMPEQVLIAFHEELVTNGALNKLIDFNQGIHAHLEFVHIGLGTGQYANIRERLVSRILKRVTPEFSFDVQEIQVQNSSLMQSLIDYAEIQHPDMLVFVTRQRNAVQRLLHPGITKQMHQRMKWPMLVLRNS